VDIFYDISAHENDEKSKMHTLLAI